MNENDISEYAPGMTITLAHPDGSVLRDRTVDSVYSVMVGKRREYVNDLLASGFRIESTGSAGFKFVDPATGRRASIATYPTREQAEESRARSIERNARGGRPDITREFIDRLIIEPEQEARS